MEMKTIEYITPNDVYGKMQIASKTNSRKQLLLLVFKKLNIKTV